MIAFNQVHCQWLFQSRMVPVLPVLVLALTTVLASSVCCAQDSDSLTEPAVPDTAATTPSEITPPETVAVEEAPSVQPVTPVATPTETTFYVNDKGTTTGPFPKSEIEKQIASSALSADALVNEVGTPQWVPLATVFPQTAPQVAAPSTPRPPTGLGQRITGMIFLGLGLVQFAGTGLCATGIYDDTLGRETCIGIQLGAGAVFTVVAIPLLISGHAKKRRYIEWKESQTTLASRVNGGFFYDAKSGTVSAGMGIGF